MNKPVRIVLLGEADESYKRLNSLVGRQFEAGKENTDEMQLLRSIKQKLDFIRANPFYGNPVAKNLIPEEYRRDYGAINLFRVELSGFWRMLYTLKGDKVEVVAFVLGIMDHPTYDKKFGYRGR